MKYGPYTAACALAEATACDHARAMATARYDRQMADSRAATNYRDKKAASEFAGFASCEARHLKRRADAWRVLAEELRDREEATQVAAADAPAEAP